MTKTTLVRWGLSFVVSVIIVTILDMPLSFQSLLILVVIGIIGGIGLGIAFAVVEWAVAHR